MSTTDTITDGMAQTEPLGVKELESGAHTSQDLIEDDYSNSTKEENIGQVEDGLQSPETTDQNAPMQPRIGYRVEYRNRFTNDLLTERVQEKGNESIINQSDGPIFEIVTSYKVVAQTLDANMDLALNSQSLPNYALRIHSVALINAIQSVVRYYPGQDLSGEYITIPKPYPVLVHYYDELQNFRKDCLSRPDEELCIREKDAAEHLHILLKYLDTEVMKDVREEQERNKRGFATFDWRWVAHKPGITVLEKEERDPDWSAYVIHSIEGGVLNNPPSPWKVRSWKLDYDGRFIQRVWNEPTVWNKFDGERKEIDHGEVTKFIDPTVNESYLEDESAQELIENGKSFVKMLEPKCYQHKGKTADFPHIEIDGLVMIDVNSFQHMYPEEVPTPMDEEDLRDWASECTCGVCVRKKQEGSKKKRDPPLFISFGSSDKDDDITDHELLLLPSKVVAWVFRTRTWELVHIRNLSEPQFNENMISHLVMNESRLKTLKALSKSFARLTKHGDAMEDKRWSADFVRGKGNGLIFLLHGKPGVGKTCTAECIAEFTRRPLMVLTSSDIGTEPRDVESNLTANFKRAMNWGAVLLIDEADVFMERRTTSDLTRNSLVAGFLRALEFYDGILFLTTNRVGSFDDAFISRIHIQLYYPDFSDDERQRVWKTFIDKLAREKGDTMRMTIDAKEYIESLRKHGLKWNGREIRNAFQTAVALAEYDAEKDSEGRIMVKDDHLRAVVELSKDFKGYLNDLHRKDEGKRAEQRYERLDSYDGTK
ncbi:ATPase family AAA domain-containing protein 3A [Colletotrichum siamense]|uniref:ATPase family AAA domain-containing protein 3A n=1 Tax=Colletotrichum siamense TaxID=690259 RepID=A0A9P5K975_COLSI|nr:ATPase family AAA domain-containing protein 3A [Colletotrichum siamense]KAF4864480.1 ATPase family AAA domain-containing protein 3A [Colletotrichum siamense]